MPLNTRLPFGHLLTALIASLAAWFRARAALQLKILALRHQIGILQRSVKHPKLTPADRFLWVWLCAVWQDWKSGTFIESLYRRWLAAKWLSPLLNLEGLDGGSRVGRRC